MKSSSFERRKGQSAIEYLMTYGWMLLVVAIVGGAIFATVQGQCSQSSTFTQGADVTVDSFAATDSNLQIVFRNTAGEQVNITNVDIDSANANVTSQSTSLPLNVGGTGTVTIDAISSAEGCNTYDVQVTYDMGQITDAVASGSLTAPMAEE